MEMTDDRSLKGWADIIERSGRQAQQAGKTPYERAVDRHEAALNALAAAQRRAAEMVAAAEREAGAALAEVALYEKQPGIALPVADQRRIEDTMVVVARRRLDERDR